jgi:hypothetical protein
MDKTTAMQNYLDYMKKVFDLLFLIDFKIRTDEKLL